MLALSPQLYLPADSPGLGSLPAFMVLTWPTFIAATMELRHEAPDWRWAYCKSPAELAGDSCTSYWEYLLGV